ncbi:MAG: carboxypeptidase regulatory-like domain-containing protein [Myxococcota bacterium]|nr:carboxypeptidase regulatory-like domain-containing protein [Myxococcota bacterium]
MKVLSISSITAFAIATLFACSDKASEPAKKAVSPKPEATKPAPAAAAKTAETATKAAAPADAEGSGSAVLSGVVSFTGDAPAETKIDMSPQPACVKVAKDTMTNEYRIKDGKVQDVFVYVKNPPKKKYDVPKEPVVLDQVGCRYTPKVFGVMVKQPIEIINSDPMMHNIHPLGKNTFNLAMPNQGMKLKKKFKKEQVLTPIMCDVHPWMKSYAGVLKHPFFAVTDAAGAFSIEGLPAGTYTVAAVHGVLGEKTTEVTVGANGEVKAEFAFTAP